MHCSSASSQPGTAEASHPHIPRRGDPRRDDGDNPRQGRAQLNGKWGRSTGNLSRASHSIPQRTGPVLPIGGLSQGHHSPSAVSGACLAKEWLVQSVPTTLKLCFLFRGQFCGLNLPLLATGKGCLTPVGPSGLAMVPCHQLHLHPPHLLQTGAVVSISGSGGVGGCTHVARSLTMIVGAILCSTGMARLTWQHHIQYCIGEAGGSPYTHTAKEHVRLEICAC